MKQTRFSQPTILHGGDYNPDQWLDQPQILRDDLRLMQLAGINCVSLGIFSWAKLEPEEGVYDFDWLAKIIDDLHAAGVRVFLATPSGAKPNWMARRYPEIRRMNARGERDPQWHRHNHCLTSPVYREKVRAINTALAQRFGQHPAVVLWHISNEYSGDCHCYFCKTAFRAFLREKYKTIDALNQAYWSAFWSHSYASFDEVDALDNSVHALMLDWRRFITHQTVDFMANEISPLKEITPQIPVTTNMMAGQDMLPFEALDYARFKEVLDVASWDAYPLWHGEVPDETLGGYVAFIHDYYRSLLNKPWLLMESTPSQTNWQTISRPKRPGMNRLAGLQAVAHGADAVCYFQFRKSRGSFEKFHGAVVDHVGNENTRVFRETSDLGAELKTLSRVAGTNIRAQAAVIWDHDNFHAINLAAGPRNKDKHYSQTVRQHHFELWRRGVACDVIESLADFSAYKLLIAPMLYMTKPGVADRLKAFVQNGGTLIATYLTGTADENDLVHLGGLPGDGLRELFGIWVEETDVLLDGQTQTVRTHQDNSLNLAGPYTARHVCEVVHAQGAEVIATYGGDFYAGTPAITCNAVSAGRAIYVASRNNDEMISDLIQSALHLSGIFGLHGTVDPLPTGISISSRTDGTTDFVFIMNFSAKPQDVELPHLFSGTLNGYDVRVIDRPRFSASM